MNLCGQGRHQLSTTPHCAPTVPKGLTPASSTPGHSPTALSLVTRHVSGPSWMSFFFVMSRF